MIHTCLTKLKQLRLAALEQPEEPLLSDSVDAVHYAVIRNPREVVNRLPMLNFFDPRRGIWATNCVLDMHEHLSPAEKASTFRILGHSYRRLSVQGDNLDEIMCNRAIQAYNSADVSTNEKSYNDLYRARAMADKVAWQLSRTLFKKWGLNPILTNLRELNKSDLKILVSLASSMFNCSRGWMEAEDPSLESLFPLSCPELIGWWPQDARQAALTTVSKVLKSGEFLMDRNFYEDYQRRLQACPHP